ncbi:MAG: DUF3833 family protein [Pseudomonadota bacterium]
MARDTASEQFGAEAFVLEEFFNGEVSAWGVFQTRFGDTKRSFSMDINGDWDGERLTLDERVVYEDGEEGDRVWIFRKTGPDRYEGLTEDVPGVSTGIVIGNEIRWTYDFRLKVGSKGMTFAFDDRMFLMPGGVVLNRVVIRKFGVRIGDLTASFHRDAAVAKAALADVA